MNHKPNNRRFRQKLLAKRAELTDEMNLTRQAAPPQSGDEGEQAAASHDHYVSLSVVSMAARELREVDEALSRIDAGEFGLCQSCEERIPQKRLNSVPWTKDCVHCQERKAPASSQYWWRERTQADAGARIA